MKYIYDGTFDGLMTVIFDAYKIIEKINIEVESNQIEIFDSIHVKTDLDKATRVKRAIINKFSKMFLTEIIEVYNSNNVNKSDVIARCVKGIFVHGVDFIKSASKSAVLFQEILKTFRKEIHTYKGLIRFKEIQDGFLLATFYPQNDILIFLTPHFLNRMPNEKFIIYDERRKKAAFCINGDCKIMFVENLTPKDSQEEKFFSSAWVKFYDAVGISERKNSKLMVSNMPKKYWKYLPEKQIRKE